MKNSVCNKEISLEDIFKRNPNVEVRDNADGKYLLFNFISLECLIINEPGKIIWESFNGQDSVSQILDHINKKMDFELNNFTTVLDFISLLFKKKIIQ